MDRKKAIQPKQGRFSMEDTSVVFLSLLITGSVVATEGFLDVPIASPQQIALQGTYTFTDAPADPFMNLRYRSDTGKDKVSESLSAKMFDASEIGSYYISGVNGVEGRTHVRAVSESMRRSFAKTGRTYFGFFSFPSLPGFFDPVDLAQQPLNYRAQSLDSIGRLWQRSPDAPYTEGAKIGFTGEHLDIANEIAVAELLANIAVTFNHAGGDESIGPLYGYYMFSEDVLTGRAFVNRMGAVNNNGEPGTAQRMRLGNGARHSDLFNDDDPYYGFNNPPKRMVPLFSAKARDSFAAFATSQQHPEITTLPADRNEFNHCVGGEWCVSLPDHVTFVPFDRQNPNIHWQLWSEWCFKMWSEFIEIIAMTIATAQAGNVDFKGSIYFQPPTAYALPESYQSPISYWYYDEEKNPVVVRDFDMVTYSYFDVINSPVSGTDMDYLMASPWFAGMIHETASSLIQDSQTQDMTREMEELFLLNSSLYQHFYVAHGATSRRRCEVSGKIFGAFVRTQHLFLPSETMNVELFNEGFDRVVDPLAPAIVFTIGDGALISGPTTEYPEHFPDPPFGGSLESEFQSRLAAYRLQAPLMLVEIPWHQTVREGGDVQFSVQVAGGLFNPSYAYRYQWQKSNDGVISWIDTPGQADSFAISNVSPSDNDTWYRCRVWVQDTNTSAVIEELNTSGARLLVIPEIIFADGFETGDASRWIS